MPTQIPTVYERIEHDPDRVSWSVAIRPAHRLKPTRSKLSPKYFEPCSEQWWRKGVCPKRDSFRQRSYDAERACYSRIESKSLANIAEVARFTRGFIEKAWFQRRFPHFRSCRVSYRPGTRVCHAGPTGEILRIGQDRHVVSGFIFMSRWGMETGGELVVLHELAHAVIPAEHQHDRRWVRTYTEFVGCAMGQGKKKMLLDEFRARKIPYSPFKRVQFTEEQKLLLAANRPAKKAES